MAGKRVSEAEKLDTDIRMILDHLAHQFGTGLEELPADDKLPNGRDLGPFVLGVWGDVRAGLAPGLAPAARSVLETVNCVFENNYDFVFAADDTDGYGSLLDAVRACSHSPQAPDAK